MSKLYLEGDDVVDIVDLLGDSDVGLRMYDTGTLGYGLNLILNGTTTVHIVSDGDTGGSDHLRQLGDLGNVLTTVTIAGSEPFSLGSASGSSITGDGVVTQSLVGMVSPVKIHSSLALVDASATTGGVTIYAGATITFGDVTLTDTGLTIKGGSGVDIIENDAKNGVVTDGNGDGDTIILGGAAATAKLGAGFGDDVAVGFSLLGTTEAPGDTLGDKVTFGAPATSTLNVDPGAEAGSTAGTTSIGLTKVVDAAAGMKINFGEITTSSNAVNETGHVASAMNLTTAENEAVDALAGPGVAYFVYKGSEYLIATNNAETAVSADDAVVKLVGVIDLVATSSSGIATLHPLV
jgi:hypothetical protein